LASIADGSVVGMTQIGMLSSDKEGKVAYGENEACVVLDYEAIPVLDGEGKYAGTLRTDDLLKFFLGEGVCDLRAAECRGVVEILDGSYRTPLFHSASMQELIESVKEHNFVPVVDDRGCFVGIVLRRDVMNYLLKFYKENDGGNT